MMTNSLQTIRFQDVFAGKLSQKFYKTDLAVQSKIQSESKRSGSDVWGPEAAISLMETGFVRAT